MSTQGQGDVVGPPNTRFVSKPVEIEAHRIGIDPWPDAAWEAVTRNEIRLYDCAKPDGYIIVRTLEGEMRGNHGDWLIRGTEGEFYPCKPSVFERKYEARTLLSSSRGEQGINAAEIAQNVAVRVAGLSDRTSPDDWPEAMLVTSEELHLIVMSEIHEALYDAKSAPGPVPTSLAGQVPDGYVLVPKEPTEEMLRSISAACRNFYDEGGPYPRSKAVYKAMLSAAPQPAAAQHHILSGAHFRSMKAGDAE